MKVFYIILFGFLSPFICTKSTEIPAFLKTHNVEWKAGDNVYILVRHAEKQSGDDPMLTEAGEIRAEKLASYFSKWNSLNLQSSNYNRTKATLKPLSRSLNKDLFIYDARKLDDYATKLKSAQSSNFIIAGHSNTTPQLANKLCDCNAFEAIDESDYTNIYVVVRSNEISRTYAIKY